MNKGEHYIFYVLTTNKGDNLIHFFLVNLKTKNDLTCSLIFDLITTYCHKAKQAYSILILEDFQFYLEPFRINGSVSIICPSIILFILMVVCHSDILFIMMGVC